MSKALFAHPPGSTRRKAWSAASGATLLALATLAAPGAALAQDRVLTVGNPFSPLSMDPSLSGNGRAGTHLMPAYEPQIRVRADGSFEPALATAWALSADSKEATFTLRRDAKFSDGEPVTADAAKKSIEYWRNKKGPFTVNLANVTAIEVLDAHRFKIKLSSPNPALLNLFEAYWLAGDLISPKAPDKPDSLGTQTFGAGPCKQDRCQGPAGRLCRPHAAASGQGLPGPRRRAGGALPIDIPKARALRAAAGYPDGFDLKLSDVNNTLSLVMSQVLAQLARDAGLALAAQWLLYPTTDLSQERDPAHAEPRLLQLHRRLGRPPQRRRPVV